MIYLHSGGKLQDVTAGIDDLILQRWAPASRHKVAQINIHSLSRSMDGLVTAKSDIERRIGSRNSKSSTVRGPKENTDSNDIERHVASE